jgi:hypothetical protein
MKSQFFGNLDARHLEGKWERLLAPLGFYDAVYDVTICAPTHFVLDYSSVPRLPFAYWIAGNTGKWESVTHDIGYRFGFLTQKKIDYIFYHAALVRSDMRTNQSCLHRTGRRIRSDLMLVAVRCAGWGSFNTAPGCLDYRNLKKCGKVCQYDINLCKNYYPKWRQCIMPGYHPEIIELHGG